MGVKEAYHEKMDAQLKTWGADIEQLKAKAAMAKADVKVEYEKQLAQLRAKHGDAHTKLEELKRSSAAAWEELKTGSEMAFDDIRQSLKHATAKFK
jgi:hypothetical protein